jgi:hypothetical protein
MSTSVRSAVEEGQPPRLVLRALNPLLRAMLRSPLHGALSKRFMLLTVTGRKTGRTYTIPVIRHESQETLTVFAAGSWRVNLRGGAPVRVTLDGRERSGHAELEEEPVRVARAYKARLDTLGVKKARDLGLKVNVDRSPTVEELMQVAEKRAIATIRLDSPAP